MWLYQGTKRGQTVKRSRTIGSGIAPTVFWRLFRAVASTVGIVLLLAVFFVTQELPRISGSIDSLGLGARSEEKQVRDNNCPDSITRETTSWALPKNPVNSSSWLNSNESYFQEIFSTCAPTVQVRLYPKCRQWELQSLDWHGNPKSVGGDEYYITYTDADLWNATTPKVTAVAWIVDQNNGRYLLDFQCSPVADCDHLTGSGVITVYFQYTCGMGRLNPPQKSAWLTGGNIVSRHFLHMPMAPPIRAFEPPEYRPNLYDFDFLLPVGDSMMQHFLQPLRQTLQRHPHPLNTSTLMQWKAYISSQYGNTDQLNSNRTALLLGSAVWDLLEDNAASNDKWEDHGQAWHKLIGFIKSTYPQVTIFWKSATALHIHKTKMIGTPQFYERLKYMSASRSWELYHLQKQWCAQQGVLFLDVYAATYLAADETLVGDGRHFTQRFNTRMIHWFVNESYVERLWRRRQLLMPKRSSSTSAIRPLIPSKCHSWMDLVNAVLVAVTTNRLVVWDPSICSLVVDQNAFPFVPSSSNNLAKDALPLKGFDDVVLDREKLEQHGLLPSKPFQRLATELFSQGADYLFGMILQRTLPWPHHTEVTIKKNFSHSVVAVWGKPTLQTEKVQNCLHQIVSGMAKSCELRVLSPEIEEDLGSHINLQRSQLSCAIEPFHPKEEYLQSLYEVAMVADGLFFPCGNLSSMLSKGLVEYLRQSNARREGRLPLDDLPYCCC